ncbi:hypothetical protein [Kordiimonas laminariae]|uniref:hypothetical protein n=1 Tax=Kordiimonas laminariae TaxID=2917717 RepID=UPI001FF5FEE9|nr:hypothetical protein [Kordiimonas laminariae]MCK0068038.1 hypothetical protein [Kordiimonas laminariae]
MTNWIIIFFAFSGALNAFLTRIRRWPVWQVNSKGIFGYSGNTLVEPDINLFWGDIELVKKDIHPHTGQDCIYLKQKDSEYAMGLAQFVILDLLPESYVDNVFAQVKNYWENHKA